MRNILVVMMLVSFICYGEENVYNYVFTTFNQLFDKSKIEHPDIETSPIKNRNERYDRYIKEFMKSKQAFKRDFEKTFKEAFPNIVKTMNKEFSNVDIEHVEIQEWVENCFELYVLTKANKITKEDDLYKKAIYIEKKLTRKYDKDEDERLPKQTEERYESGSAFYSEIKIWKNLGI